jgi:hypothetical protein
LAKKKRKQTIRRKAGDILRIPLGGGEYGFGHVLRSPLVAFYDAKSPPDLPIDEIVGRPVLFKIWVTKAAVQGGAWQVIGHMPLPEELLVEPWFFKKDSLTGALSLYRYPEEVPATRRDCEGLECAAVWDGQHVVDRLRDHFAGRKNAWVESMRP